MSRTAERLLGRRARHRRIRKKVVGLAQRPRICVFRSHKHLHAQVVDDLVAKTLLGSSTLDKRLRASVKKGGTTAAAQALGKLVAEEAMKQGIKQAVFDRGGYRYHGRVKAFADAVRAGGVQI